jgi:hypothetical protein
MAAILMIPIQSESLGTKKGRLLVNQRSAGRFRVGRGALFSSMRSATLRWRRRPTFAGCNKRIYYGRRPQPSNKSRIIAATNKGLAAGSAKGLFEDLFSV